MIIDYEPLSHANQSSFIDIYNYYVENDLSVFSDKKISEKELDFFVNSLKNYPAYAIKYEGEVRGYCYLSPFAMSEVFAECAEASIYIHKDYQMKSLGRRALIQLEKDARARGIKSLLVRMSSGNPYLSIRNKFGYKECARFKNVGKKHNTYFDVVWLQKVL